MQDLNLFFLFTDKLEQNHIEYFITGSVASIVYGQPCLTHDIDLVIVLYPNQINALCESFPINEFYCLWSMLLLKNWNFKEKARPKNIFRI